MQGPTIVLAGGAGSSGSQGSGSSGSSIDSSSSDTSAGSSSGNSGSSSACAELVILLNRSSISYGAAVRAHRAAALLVLP